MPDLQRTPISAALNERGNVVIEFAPDQLFTLEGLRGMFILPIPYEELRERVGGRAPAPHRFNDKDCLSAREAVQIINLLKEDLGTGVVDGGNGPLEGEQG